MTIDEYYEAVLLKQFIKEHWQEDEENFVHPVVSPEKVVIRELLLPSLNDPHGKIRTAIGMAIASIAQYDWPEDWPELLPFLLNLISDEGNRDGVHGALRCLALLSSDLDDTVVPKLVPSLFPHLHTIISSPHVLRLWFAGSCQYLDGYRCPDANQLIDFDFDENKSSKGP